MADRVFRPLGMVDTGFAVPAEAQSRLAPCYVPDGAGGLDVFDPADQSDWRELPAFPHAGGGLGTTWFNYPEHETAAILLTQHLPPAIPVIDAFWTTLHADLEA